MKECRKERNKSTDFRFEILDPEILITVTERVKTLITKASRLMKRS